MAGAVMVGWMVWWGPAVADGAGDGHSFPSYFFGSAAIGWVAGVEALGNVTRMGIPGGVSRYSLGAAATDWLVGAETSGGAKRLGEARNAMMKPQVTRAR